MSKVPLHKKIFFTGIVLLLLLGALEIGLRLAWTRPPSFMGSHLRETGLFETDPDLGWRLKPDFTVEHRLPSGDYVTVHTNGAGFRDQDHDPAVGQGKPRILVIGDSFTFGYGVNNGEIFTDHLQQLLPGMEIINMGVTAYNTWQEHRLLRKVGFAYEPDLVILAFCQNDVMEQGIPQAVLAPPKPKRSWRHRVAENCYVYDYLRTRVNHCKPLARMLVSLGVKESLGGFPDLDTNVRPFLIDYPPAMTELWDRTLLEVSGIHQACRDHGCGFMIVAIPALQSVSDQALRDALSYMEYEPVDFDLDKPYRNLQAFCKKEGILFLDPRIHISPLDAGLYLEQDMHFNALGHEYLAKMLAPHIKPCLERN